METIIANGFSWLTKHVPAVALIGLLMVSVYWMGVKVATFEYRLAETERICNDINTHQLPEIRAEIKNLNDRITKLEISMNEKFVRIELQLNTIITHIETKEGSNRNSRNLTAPVSLHLQKTPNAHSLHNHSSTHGHS